jgi:hypothetical protein
MEKYLSVEQITILKNKYLKDVYGKYYMFDNHWREIASHTSITHYIRTHFTDKIKKIHGSYYNFLLDIDFHTKRDPKHLICFTNGVYDLQQSKFRDGLKEDYCTYCTNYAYYNDNNDNFNKYINTVFPHSEDLKQFLCVMFIIFKGNKIFIESEGTDNSGINTIYRLISMVFGTYIENHTGHYLSDSKISNVSYFKDLKQNFKGRSIFVSWVIQEEYNCLPVTMITDKKYGNQTKLSFKSTFSTEEDPINNVYKMTTGLGKQLPSFALALMNKMISIEQSPLKIMYFMSNGVFIQDVTNYILAMYEDLLYT